MSDSDKNSKNFSKSYGEKRNGKSKDPSKLTSASDVLQSLLQNSKSPMGQGFTRWKIWHLWPEIVGGEIAKYSRPVGYRNGILYVWVENSVRMQEMIFVVKSMIANINKRVGRSWVKRIQFTLDTKNVPGLQEAQKEMVEFIESAVKD